MNAEEGHEGHDHGAHGGEGFYGHLELNIFADKITSVSSDGKYAFVSVEGIQDDPGKVDVIDLQTLKVVDTADLGKQAGGIAFWKISED